jgi:hypothetical protein
MTELKDFQPSQLVKLIAQETISYYRLIGDGASVEECTQCNSWIKQIELELDSRRDQEEKKILRQRSSPLEYSC